MKRITFLFLLFIISGCSNLSFSTNIGPYASGRARAVLVEEYSLEEIARYDAILLGVVESSYCQEHIDEPRPSKSALVKDLKVKAHSLGGNGIVVEACGKASYGTCQQYLECRGTAYSVPQRQTMP